MDIERDGNGMPDQAPQESPMDPSVAAPPRPSAKAALAAIPRIFLAPRSVYEQIRDGMPWWPGLLVVLLLTAIIFHFFAPFMAEAFYSMVQTGEVNFPVDEVKDMSLDEFVGKARIFIVIMMLLGTIISLLFATLFYWLGTIVTFGSTSFGRVFTNKIYATFIALLFAALNLVYLRMTAPEFSNMEELSAARLDLSPALLMGEATGFLVRFMREINVFSVWELLIFNAGVACLLGRRWSQTLWPIGIIFLLGVLVRSISG